MQAEHLLNATVANHVHDCNHTYDLKSVTERNDLEQTSKPCSTKQMRPATAESSNYPDAAKHNLSYHKAFANNSWIVKSIYFIRKHEY